jgi:hypothetical protein
MSLSRWSLACMLLLLGAVALGQDMSYYVEPGTYSTQRETDPPAYVKNLGGELDWLAFGLQQRLRYERRDDDIRRFDDSGFDDPWLSRTRVYLGLRNRIDPLRFAVEIQDSRRFDSRYAPDNRDTNKVDFIQAYAELHFDAAVRADPRGNARPLTIRYGRHGFELLDKRLFARSEWRNTTNSFEGLRASLGQDSNDWQLEFMSLHPLVRLLSDTDRADRNQRFNALVAHWRRWPRLTVEPHYFYLKQDAHPANGNRERTIRAPGLRVYGKTADGALNYEMSVMAQSGADGALRHRAHSLTAETGYIWLEQAWRPRLALMYGYASGDRDPRDGESNRFERFFGFGRIWSANEYVTHENVEAARLRGEFQPIQGLRVEAGYSAYWLASARDRFSSLLGGTAFNRDATGRSGDFVGEEVDARVRFSAGAFVNVTLGYTHFATGEFVRNRQRAALGDSAADSDFAYLELMFSLF